MAVRLTLKYRKTVYFLCLYLKSVTVQNYLSRCVYNDGQERISILYEYLNIIMNAKSSFFDFVFCFCIYSTAPGFHE